MTAYRYRGTISLYVEDRIPQEAARRQERTARDVLDRLSNQPGVILGDEVGMGKTFVALAVAASVALQDERSRSVVIMVPPSLLQKWKNDAGVFSAKCLAEPDRKSFRFAGAEKPVEFLKYLDDTGKKRNALIFLTHGALNRALEDPWVRVAIIQRALHYRKDTAGLKRALFRILGRLVRMTDVQYRHGDIWPELFTRPTEQWRCFLVERGVLGESADDPVPQAIARALSRFRADGVYAALQRIPRRETKYFDDTLKEARQAITAAIKEVWSDCLRGLNKSERLPLLVFDEAHHLKNAQTRVSSLFHTKESKADAEQVSQGGELDGVFDRMLFLTATPFQLGHDELCSVLERFGGVRWRPEGGRELFRRKIDALRQKLDLGQEAAVRLDKAWGRIQAEDLRVGRTIHPTVEDWWARAKTSPRDLSVAAAEALKRFNEARASLKEAEALLRPWVVRHLKPRHLPRPHAGVPRRRQLPGGAIHPDAAPDGDVGLRISGDAVVPFLLAARAVAGSPGSRPVFAEGLSSSYEAFLDTRAQRRAALAKPVVDHDDEGGKEQPAADATTQWYLDRIACALKTVSSGTASHPKIAATTARVLDLWRKGEKVLVFCHYIATGRALRQTISRAIAERIEKQAAERLGCDRREAMATLRRIGDRFDKKGSPIRRATDDEVERLLLGFPTLKAERQRLLRTVRSYMRTPSFLVRFFPIKSGRILAEDVMRALERPDGSSFTLKKMLGDFFSFLGERCGEEERERYLFAAASLATGSYAAADVRKTFAKDELEQSGRSEVLMPNVRLANGQVSRKTRDMLMLTFNTPLFPEVLIASSVMAEGVDLHLNCRHVIHHDLCWNPSTLEQRTGRVDRIGAKMEKAGKPVDVFLPYVAETQDQKMYRVVMDRERWFKVVMGDRYSVDAETTERLARRVPLPEAAARELMFDLETRVKSRP